MSDAILELHFSHPLREFGLNLPAALDVVQDFCSQTPDASFWLRAFGS
jgi:hypothetical protein